MKTYHLLITCPKGIELLLTEELQTFGSKILNTTVGGIYIESDLKSIYLICLHSRLANRVLLCITKAAVQSSQDCYQVVKTVQWPEIFPVRRSMAVKFHGSSKFIKNAMYGGQLVKDAIADVFREQLSVRPNVVPNNPDCLIDARLQNRELKIFLDLSGHSLHQRGYRSKAGSAPLKENLAAALLLRAQWPKLAKLGYHFLDPFCGSGTLLIEAAMMAVNKAPGLDVKQFGFLSWADHQPKLWQECLLEAKVLFEKSAQENQSKFFGFDKDDNLIQIAKNNVNQADLSVEIDLQTKDIKNFSVPEAISSSKGLIVTNPPYGERLDENANWIPTYQSFGQAIANCCQGWEVAVLTSEKILAKAIGLRSTKQYTFLNGSLPCKLYVFSINEQNKFRDSTDDAAIPETVMAFYNRLQKNKKHLQSWLKKQAIQAYRIYDADIPEYSLAIDVYDDWVHVQEYQAPKSISPNIAQKRLLNALQVIPKVLPISANNIVVKQRQIQKGKSQYQRHAETQHGLHIREGAANFVVNCRDYLDTGLFLDHRALRRHFYQIAKNKRFLNLFCYTATASVQAALGGAWQTVSVDMSKTYLEWAKKNFVLNHLNLKRHQLIQEDCFQWLKKCKEKFDLIFLDPPTFSNSKRMQETLDIQRDHQTLIRSTMRLLNKEGELYFSTNLRKFKLDEQLRKDFLIEDYTQKSLDKDFVRSPNIHHCFKIRLACDKIRQNLK